MASFPVDVAETPFPPVAEIVTASPLREVTPSALPVPLAITSRASLEPLVSVNVEAVVPLQHVIGLHALASRSP